MEDRVIALNQPAAPAPISMFDFGTNLDRAWKFAETLSKSAIIPDTFRGNPASCLIALDMATRMRRNPLEVMQAMYIVHGKPSLSSSFLISLINSCGYYEPLRFEFKGVSMERSCMAWTVDKRTGEKVEGPIISVQMAKAEGWYDKSGSKWKTMPDVMLRYRAASFFSRAYCPDLTGGFHSVEEARDDSNAYLDTERAPAIDLKAELLAQPKPELPTQPKPELPAQPKPELPAKTQSEAPTLAPIEEDMFPLDDVPVAAPVSTVQPILPSEIEKLRAELIKLLTINHTAEESEAWCVSNFGKEMKKLVKDELKAAITKANAELDARDK